MSTIVAFVVDMDQPVRVTRQSQTGIDNFDTVLEIPANRFVTGHDYVVVFSGWLGDRNVPGGSGLGNVPFFALYQRLSWPASTKLSIVATRRSGSGANRREVMPYVGNLPFGTFLTQQGTFFGTFGLSIPFDVCASMLVFDLTELTNTGIPWLWGASASPQAFPVAPTQLVASSITLPGTGNWLSCYSVCCQPASESTPPGLRCIHRWHFDGNPLNNDATYYANGGRAASNNLQLCNGKFMAASPFIVAGSGAFQALCQDEATFPVFGQSRLIDAHCFAVKLDPRLFAVHTQPGATKINFWSFTVPFDGEELLLQTTPSYYYSDVVLSQVNNPIDPTLPPGNHMSGTGILEIEGEPIGGPPQPFTPISTGVGLRGRVAEQKIGRHDHGGGRHYVTLRGGVGGAFQRLAPPPPLSADDIQIVLLNGIVDVIPPAPVAELPGPVTAFVPQRETTVSISSLPLLPVEPSWSKPIQRELPMRELKIPTTGYTISSPKFSRAIERVGMGWMGRSTADIDAVLAFLDGLKTSNGAFRWRPKWESAEQAYAIEEFTIEEDNPNQRGVRSLSCTVLKLVWVAP